MNTKSKGLLIFVVLLPVTLLFLIVCIGILYSHKNVTALNNPYYRFYFLLVNTIVISRFISLIFDILSRYKELSKQNKDNLTNLQSQGYDPLMEKNTANKESNLNIDKEVIEMSSEFPVKKAKKKGHKSVKKSSTKKKKKTSKSAKKK